jgi:rhamnogalacturonyl hydrolase YesR
MKHNLKGKRYGEIAKVFKDQEQVIEELRAVTKSLQELKDYNNSLFYVKHALSKGYGVGDTVFHPDRKEKYTVTAWVNGLFVGRPTAGRATKAIALYDGWRRVISQGRI